VLAIILVAFGTLLLADLGTVLDQGPRGYEELRGALAVQSAWGAEIAARLPSADALPGLLARAQTEALGSTLLGLTGSAVGLLTLLVSVAALTFYWLLEQQRIERLWLSLLPIGARATARAVWERLSAEVGRYIRAEAVLGVYGGAGLPVPALLAVIGGVAQIVPLLALPLALLPGLLVAWAVGPGTLLATLLGSLVVLGLIQLFVVPRLFRNGINVNPVLTIVLIMALYELGGIWLMLLAPPLAAAIQTATRVLTSERVVTVASDAMPTLRQRLDLIERNLTPEERANPQLNDLLARTRQLVDETADLLPEALPPPSAMGGPPALGPAP
jgi:predicted PurR-regulated permease PerM